MPAIRSQEIIDALMALAARDGLGDEIAWSDVEPAIADLLDTAVSASNLRRRMEKVNDAEVALTMADWFERAADARAADARAAARPSEKVLAPIQGVGLGGTVTAVILASSGTLALAAGVILGVSGLILAGVATLARLRLSEREDTAKQDATAIRRLADVARKRGEKT